MLKKDLLEKIEAIGEDIEITEEVLGFAKPKEVVFDVNDLTLEQFKEVIDNNAKINGYYQSTLDQKVSKGINTFKEKTMPSLIEEAVKAKSNEGLTPEQLQIKEMQAQLDAMRAEKEQAELLNTNVTKLKDSGLDTSLAPYIKSDEDINFFKGLIDSAVQAGVKAKLGDSNYQPPTNESGVITITKEQFARMGYAEKVELYNTDRELYNELTK